MKEDAEQQLDAFRGALRMTKNISVAVIRIQIRNALANNDNEKDLVRMDMIDIEIKRNEFVNQVWSALPPTFILNEFKVDH